MKKNINNGLYILFYSTSYFVCRIKLVVFNVPEFIVFRTGFPSPVLYACPSLAPPDSLPLSIVRINPFSASLNRETDLLYSHTGLSHGTSAGRSGRRTKYADSHHVLQTVNSFTARLRSLFKIALTEVSGIKLRGP